MRVPLLILGSQLADLAAFLLAAQAVGLGGERNALAVAIVLGAGYPALVALKVAAAVVAASLAPRVRPRWGLLAVAIGLLGALTGIVAVW